jgi:transcription initiation factor TFIID subunit 10
VAGKKGNQETNWMAHYSSQIKAESMESDMDTTPAPETPGTVVQGPGPIFSPYTLPAPTSSSIVSEMTAPVPPKVVTFAPMAPREEILGASSVAPPPVPVTQVFAHKSAPAPIVTVLAPGFDSTSMAGGKGVTDSNSSIPKPPVATTPIIHQYSLPATPTRHYAASGGDVSPADVSGFSFSDFLVQLEDYHPTLPDSVANHFLQLSGFESSDPRMSRLISIAAQKYISDIINDAFTHCKLKAQVPVGKAKIKDKKYVLTMEDLIPVLNDYGITVRKPPYFL